MTDAEPLCSLPKAQAIIDRQAARIAELEALLGKIWPLINGAKDAVHDEIKAALAKKNKQLGDELAALKAKAAVPYALLQWTLEDEPESTLFDQGYNAARGWVRIQLAAASAQPQSDAVQSNDGAGS